MVSHDFKWRLRLYAPVTCGVAMVSFLILVVDIANSTSLPSGKRPPLAEAFQLLPRRHMRPVWDLYRLITYTLVHTGWSHFTNNFATILLIGPILEEKLGRRNYCWLLAASTIVPGILYSLVVTDYALVGASGVVFATIIVSAGLKTTRTSDGTLEVPVTFVLLGAFWLMHEIMSTLTTSDNVSRLGHILGGAVGVAWVVMYTKRPPSSSWKVL